MFPTATGRRLASFAITLPNIGRKSKTATSPFTIYWTNFILTYFKENHEMKTITYNGKTYLTDLEEDESYAGGIWDLSGSVASTICSITDPCNYNHYEDIQEIVYKLIKDNILAELEKTNRYVYMVVFDWSTCDDDGYEIKLFDTYEKALEQYDRYIENECDAELSWVGEEVFDENGEVNEGYELHCCEQTEGEQDLYWKVADKNDYCRHSYLYLSKEAVL
ncbi:MAG: hypothetical protein NC114_08840 [Ruminococcus flavefaciens]|nr:hypothetical protein [Ruminococcus flavefaciens]